MAPLVQAPEAEVGRDGWRVACSRCESIGCSIWGRSQRRTGTSRTARRRGSYCA